ncbi:hypothetical protein WR164_01800 [Philodulcilactobacillus myokoensis]|uniref:Uncharacterized protein n=1 Tax=Philodulcilactobacillus myokoensis TaxID=2929573 RepID=A0A9W6B077_9LACO|nr:hypothetical protein [Philodulcilactobacillus myokoensis]GLB46201.1 hypothetical protein WR164_01800 [Philodulcilactobacillus myokoensis]
MIKLNKFNLNEHGLPKEIQLSYVVLYVMANHHVDEKFSRKDLKKLCPFYLGLPNNLRNKRSSNKSRQPLIDTYAEFELSSLFRTGLISRSKVDKKSPKYYINPLGCYLINFYKDDLYGFIKKIKLLYKNRNLKSFPFMVDIIFNTVNDKYISFKLNK